MENNDLSALRVIFSTGSPEPGIYYVGVYNDKHLADQPIRNYTLSFAISGSCAADASGAATCADGFVGAERRDVREGREGRPEPGPALESRVRGGPPTRASSRLLLPVHEP